MICPECGTENPDAAVYCMKCSRQMPQAGQTVAPTGVTAAMPTRATEYLPPQHHLLAEHSVIGGRYEVVSLLGRGGMGAVYEVIDRFLERRIALKLIRPEFGDDPLMLKRFKQELILAQQVSHPNVIQIYDLSI